MYKRTLLALLLVCLSFSLWNGAVSAEDMPPADVRKIFGEEFRAQFGLQDLYSASPMSFAVTGNRAYQLMTSGDIYSCDLETGEYSLYASVPALPQLGYSAEMKYSDLDDGVKAIVDGAVFQIIGRIDGDELYGYCPTSGRIGPIDDAGIHWNDVRLDNSIQMKEDPAYPEDLMYARIVGETLYAFRNRAENAEMPCEGQILKFSLETGDCRTADVPGAYMLCCTPSARALLLCREAQGRMVLRGYDLLSETMDDFAYPLPPSLNQGVEEDWFSVMMLSSGLAWCEDRGDVLIAAPDCLWQCADDGNLRRIPLYGPAWEELSAYSEAWFSENGYYVFKNAGRYVVSVD